MLTTGPTYKVNRASTALSTTADFFTIIAPSTASLIIRDITVTGGATASAYNEILVQRSTGGATGGGAITPAPTHPSFAAAGFTVNTTWGTQPTLTANAVIDRIGVNANGGGVRKSGLAYVIPPSGQVSVRSASGTSAVTIDMTIEQI